MIITNLRDKNRSTEMPYPVMTRMQEALPQLEKMFKAIRTKFPRGNVELVGTGTSGASIGMWLQQRSKYRFNYTHIKEKGSYISHRRGSFGNLSGVGQRLVIVDDKIATGTTLCHIIHELPVNTVVEAITVTWSYFSKDMSAFRAIESAAFHNNVTIKELIVL